MQLETLTWSRQWVGFFVYLCYARTSYMCTCTCIHSFLASDVSTWQCRERGDNKSAPADLRFRLASFIHSVNSPRANFKIQIQIQIQGIASFIHSVNSPRKSQDSNNQLIHIIPLLAAITSLHFSQFWSLRLSDSKRLLPESPVFFYWWFLSLSQKFSVSRNSCTSMIIRRYPGDEEKEEKVITRCYRSHLELSIRM